MRKGEKTAGALFLTLFAVSGAAGLIYEVVWMRQLTTVLGSSSYAVTIVLATFMTGLGLGAWALGRLSDRMGAGWLALAYFGLEIAIAGYAWMFPRLLESAQWAYVAFYRHFQPEPATAHALQLMLAFVLLLLPTTLMGATLPVVCRYLIRQRSSMPIRLSALYAVNTAGAIAGTLAAGYWLLPLFGIAKTTALAVLLNLAAGVGFALLHRLFHSSSADEPTLKCQPQAAMTTLQRGVIVGLGISGMAAMFYQVAWTRTLSMTLGNTTFAFTTMLATFLVGIAMGSASYRFLPAKKSDQTWFVRIQVLAAFSALATVPLLEKLPFFYLYLHQTHGGSWAELQALRFSLSALVMFVPTFALGAMFPVAAALLVDGLDQMGSRIGRAYAFNTWGAVLGSIVAGLVLVPLAGLQKTIVFGALLNLAAGLAVCLLSTEGVFVRRMVTVIGSGLAMVGCIAVLKPWSPNILNSGVFLYAERYLAMEERVRGEFQKKDKDQALNSKDIWKLSMQQFNMVYHRTGAIATVAVMDAPDGVRFLTINGKTDASTGERSDMRTQVMIAQLPMLLHEQPDRVLVVGLGSGVTAGSALTHENAMVDCVEIVPEVIEAARFFSHANNNALDNPRLRLIPRDARNFLLTHDQKYDVIISQPSNPWIKGESSLFSAEWYRLVKQSLEEGGAVCAVAAFLPDG